MKDKKPDKRPPSNVSNPLGDQMTTYYGDDNKPLYEVIEKRNGQTIIKRLK